MLPPLPSQIMHSAPTVFSEGSAGSATPSAATAALDRSPVGHTQARLASLHHMYQNIHLEPTIRIGSHMLFRLVRHGSVAPEYGLATTATATAVGSLAAADDEAMIQVALALGTSGSGGLSYSLLRMLRETRAESPWVAAAVVAGAAAAHPLPFQSMAWPSAFVHHSTHLGTSVHGHGGSRGLISLRSVGSAKSGSSGDNE